jgi:dihydrodipicolinate synthase/N-acetylneuraminate lyase
MGLIAGGIRLPLLPLTPNGQERMLSAMRLAGIVFDSESRQR